MIFKRTLVTVAAAQVLTRHEHHFLLLVLTLSCLFKYLFDKI